MYLGIIVKVLKVGLGKSLIILLALETFVFTQHWYEGLW